MGNKFFRVLLFDVMLPIAGILLIGRVLAQRFDYPIFHFLDTIRAFGLGFWFAESEARVRLLDASRYIFAFFPAVAWVAWIRINLEHDRATGTIRLDRPIFRFCSGLARRIRNSVRSPEDFPRAVPPLASLMPTVPASAAIPKSPLADPPRGSGAPVLRMEPVRLAEPVQRAEPALRAEPVVRAEPNLRAEPVVRAEPNLRAEPVVRAEPNLRPEPVRAEPSLRPQPVVRPEPSLREEPAAQPEPIRRVEPPANLPDDVMPPAPAPAPGVRRTFAPGPAYPRRAR
jgi:hypothetical protein